MDGGAGWAEVCDGATLKSEAGEADELAVGDGGDVGEEWAGSEKAVETGVGEGLSLSRVSLGGGKVSGVVFWVTRGRRESGTGGQVWVAARSGETFEG